MEARYVVYGRLDSRETVALLSALRAKGLRASRIDESPSLAFELAARTGRDRGPYLRTPEGFVLADLHAILESIERLHPEPVLLPPRQQPVRRVCARILEAWIESWLPIWPDRSWSPLERLGRHLEASRFLLGPQPTRPDWLLAAWLEVDVLAQPRARSHLERHAPSLVGLGGELLAGAGAGGSSAEAGSARDDAIPISLLPVLEEVASGFHAYLEANRLALTTGGSEAALEMPFGRRLFPVRFESEVRRREIGCELAGLPEAARCAVRRVLDPVGARRVYLAPTALEPIDPGDPRSL